MSADPRAAATPDPAALLAPRAFNPEPEIPLTRQQKRAGIAEAVLRASFDMPEMGDDDVVVTGRWIHGTGGAVGVFVKGEHVTGGVVFEKTYDDLSVMGQLRIRR